MIFLFFSSYSCYFFRLQTKYILDKFFSAIFCLSSLLDWKEELLGTRDQGWDWGFRSVIKFLQKRVQKRLNFGLGNGCKLSLKLPILSLFFGSSWDFWLNVQPVAKRAQFWENRTNLVTFAGMLNRQSHFMKNLNNFKLHQISVANYCDV